MPETNLEKNRQPDLLVCGEFSGEAEEAACPLCTEPSAPRLVFRKKNGVSILQCPCCRIMYASPRFSEKSLLAIYENPAFINEKDFEKFKDWSYEKWKKDRDGSYLIASLKTELVKKYLGPDDPILDIGCGIGLFLVQARANGLKAEGLEPSQMLCKLGKEKFGVDIHNMLPEQFTPAQKYRCILLWDVLEHVYHPLMLLQKCNDLLQQGGYLFLHTPNYDGLSDRWKTTLCQMRLKKCDFKHFGFPWHVFSFNRESLSAIVKGAGFTPLLIESWSHFIRDGEANFLTEKLASFMRKRCLADNITCVARKC